MKRVAALKRAVALLFVIVFALSGLAFAASSSGISEKKLKSAEKKVERGECYSAPDMVAAYLHLFQELPPNFVTKEDAMDCGWISSKGNLWDVLPDYSIGGDRFGNREGLLPKAKKRQYYECDVNYYGGYRGKERIIYSNDGLIYYTNDHYRTFALLYGKELLK